MKHFIIKNRKKLVKLGVVLFWLLVWQWVTLLIHQEILLPSPASVLHSLIFLSTTHVFWLSIVISFAKIATGFLAALGFGIISAIISFKSYLFRQLLFPLITIIKATPVASFVILALVWIGSSYLSIFISFLMAFPIVYINIYEGICQTDTKLLEMARIFKIRPFKIVRYIYIPGILPYFMSAVSLCAGLCWKSGIAAEVIGLPAFSIGSSLYEAKIFLNTDEMFAWTFVVVCISILFEKGITMLTLSFQKRNGVSLNGN